MPTRSKQCTPDNTDPATRAVVIVPVYNRAGLLLRCLDSIAAQTFRPLRLVVVDNMSTDSSADVARRWAGDNLTDDPTAAPQPDALTVNVISCPRRGAAAARQAGVDALGDMGRDHNTILFFFDSDDAMRPGFVESPMRHFAAHPDIDMCCWTLCLHGSDGSSRVLRRADAADMWTSHLVHGVLGTPRFATRADFFARAGGWNADIDVWDDWELGARLLLAAPRLRCIPDVSGDIYPQAESITGTAFSQRRGRWEAVLDRLDALFADRPDLRRLVNYRRIILAAHYAREGKPADALALKNLALDQLHGDTLRHLGLQLAYHWTAAGLRGAHTIFRPLL